MELELEPLVAELERQKANSKDIIVDSRNIFTEAHREPPDMDLDLVLYILGNEEGTIENYPLTEFAHTVSREDRNTAEILQSHERSTAY